MGGILPLAAAARHGAVSLQVGPWMGKEMSFEPWPGSLLLLNFCGFCRQNRHGSASHIKWYFSVSQEKANSCPFSLYIAGMGYTNFIISSETAEPVCLPQEQDELLLHNCKIYCQKGGGEKKILKSCKHNTELSQLEAERSRDGNREQSFPGSCLQLMPLLWSSRAAGANGDLRVAGTDELAPAPLKPLIHAAVTLPFPAGPGGASPSTTRCLLRLFTSSGGEPRLLGQRQPAAGGERQRGAAGGEPALPGARAPGPHAASVASLAF